MDQWNAKELKAYIEKNGGSYVDCVEKSDFLARAKAIAEKVRFWVLDRALHNFV